MDTRNKSASIPFHSGPMTGRGPLGHRRPPFATSFTLWLLPLAFLLSGLTAGPAVAQERDGGGQAVEVDPPVFGEVIDVRVVNLEVVVRKKGVRVSGLGPDDFILEVDRRERPIEYFTEVVGGVASAPTGNEAGGTVPALAPGERVGNSYLVFIDEYFTRPNDHKRVLMALQDQLGNLGPEDRMAIVAYDGTKVEMLSTWSQSTERLEDVLRRAASRPVYGLQRQAERRIFDTGASSTGGVGPDPLTQSATELPVSGLTVEERQMVDLISAQVQKITLAATSALRSFANPPGRKVMLLLSGGWPRDPAQWVVSDPNRAITASEFYREDLLDPLIETANRLSYTLYPVDVGGLNTTGVDAQDVTLDDAVARRTQVLDREQEEEFALLFLADETGGRALLDSASLTALERVAEDTRSYYWIGFTPDWQGDDSEHKVRVRLRDKSLDVSTRSSFSDLSREREVTMMVESSLVFGNPPTAAPLIVKAGEPHRSGIGKVKVPLEIVIPVAELTFLPQGDKWLADTELRVAVLDEQGNTADIPVFPLGIRTASQPDPGDFTIYKTEVKMRKRKHDMVVAIYDKASGKILSSKITVDPR